MLMMVFIFWAAQQSTKSKIMNNGNYCTPRQSPLSKHSSQRNKLISDNDYSYYKYRYRINSTVMSQRENVHRKCVNHWVPSHALANYFVSWFLIISHLTLVSFKHCPEHTLGVYCHCYGNILFLCAPPSLYCWKNEVPCLWRFLIW